MTDAIDTGRRGMLAAGAMLPLAAAFPEKAWSEGRPIRNPLVLRRADPHILRHDDDFYMTASVPEYDRVVLRRATTVASLSDASEAVLWRRPTSGRMAG